MWKSSPAFSKRIFRLALSTLDDFPTETTRKCICWSSKNKDREIRGSALAAIASLSAARRSNNLLTYVLGELKPSNSGVQE